MCRLLFVPENGRIGEVHMKNLAIILAACGSVIMALSAILLGYVERSSTEHMMCLADIILGFIIHHRPQRQAGQLYKKLLADRLENAEGRLVRNAKRAVVERRAGKKSAERHAKPRQAPISALPGFVLSSMIPSYELADANRWLYGKAAVSDSRSIRLLHGLPENFKESGTVIAAQKLDVFRRFLAAHPMADDFKDTFKPRGCDDMQ